MVLAPLAIPLAVLLAGLVLLALARTAQAWARPLVEIITANHHNLIVHILTLPVRLITRVVLPGVNYVTHRLTVAASHYMHPVAHWFDALSGFALGSAVTVGLFAERTAIAFEHLTAKVLPREIGKAVKPVNRKALEALVLGGLATAAIELLGKQLRHLIHHDVMPKVTHAAHAVDTAIPREFGRIRTRVKNLEDDFTHPGTRWLRRIATAMWATTMLGLMVKALAKKFPWLFCRKVKSVGNRVCGLDTDLLGSLLTDTLLISGSISIVVFARELAAILRLFERLFLDFIGELKRVELDYLGHVEPVIDLDNILSLTIPDDYFGPI